MYKRQPLGYLKADAVNGLDHIASGTVIFFYVANTYQFIHIDSSFLFDVLSVYRTKGLPCMGFPYRNLTVLKDFYIF